MKHFWIGVSILAVLLAGGIGSTVCLDRAMDQVGDRLEQAQEAAAAGDLDSARQAVAAAQKIWKQNRPLAACLADHEPLEQLDQGFHELEVWDRAEEPAQYEALCCILRQQALALATGEKPHFYNIL